jgi:hypothetical protein
MCLRYVPLFINWVRLALLDYDVSKLNAPKDRAPPTDTIRVGRAGEYQFCANSCLHNEQSCPATLSSKISVVEQEHDSSPAPPDPGKPPRECHDDLCFPCTSSTCRYSSSSRREPRFAETWHIHEDGTIYAWIRYATPYVLTRSDFFFLFPDLNCPASWAPHSKLIMALESTQESTMAPHSAEPSRDTQQARRYLS